MFVDAAWKTNDSRLAGVAYRGDRKFLRWVSKGMIRIHLRALKQSNPVCH